MSGQSLAQRHCDVGRPRMERAVRPRAFSTRPLRGRFHMEEAGGRLDLLSISISAPSLLWQIQKTPRGLQPTAQGFRSQLACRLTMGRARRGLWVVPRQPMKPVGSVPSSPALTSVVLRGSSEALSCLWGGDWPLGSCLSRDPSSGRRHRKPCVRCHCLYRATDAGGLGPSVERQA